MPFRAALALVSVPADFLRLLVVGCAEPFVSSLLSSLLSLLLSSALPLSPLPLALESSSSLRSSSDEDILVRAAAGCRHLPY